MFLNLLSVSNLSVRLWGSPWSVIVSSRVRFFLSFFNNCTCLRKVEKNGAAVGLIYGARHAAPTASTAPPVLPACTNLHANAKFGNQVAIAFWALLT